MTKSDHESNVDDLDLALALRRLDETSPVPPPDPAHEAALMAAFDAAQLARPLRRSGRQYWAMGGLAAAAVLLIATGLGPALSERSESKRWTGRHASSDGSQATHKPPSSLRGVQSIQPPSEFVMVPGALGLPEMESGSLVRMDVPVTLLPSLGVTPPANAVAKVRADVIVGQDGLPRAVRLVN
jgi:hypothetical protein